MKKTILSLSILIFFTTTVYGNENVDLTRDESLKVINEAFSIIDENYVGSDINNRGLINAAMYGIATYLDQYSNFYEENYINGNFSDFIDDDFYIGFQLDNNGGYYVGEILDGYPATNSKIVIGEEIIKVGGTNISELSKTDIENYLYFVAERKKTITTLKNNLPYTYTFEFNEFPTSISYYKGTETEYLKNKNICIIDIDEFTRSTGLEFQEALKSIREYGSENLVIDLRGNPGGYVVSMNETLEQILPKGNAYNIIYKNGDYYSHYTNTINESIFDEIIILVDEYTASSAEIFAGVMQSRGHAKIVGTPTTGKGVSQNYFDIYVEDIDYVGAFQLTNGLIEINGETYNNKGLVPDYLAITPFYITNTTTDDAWLEFYGINMNDYVSFLLNELKYSSIKEFQNKKEIYVSDELNKETIDKLNDESAHISPDKIYLSIVNDIIND
ncbi:MAG: S41 family peptidase [Lachnospirales bacterium]